MMDTSQETQAFETEFDIADWHINTSLCSLSKGDVVVKIEPKVMDLLVCFAQRPNQVLSREELERKIWPDTIVGYDALSSAIIKLRKAFDDDARKPRIIETVSKRGYRLIASVSKTIPPQERDVPGITPAMPGPGSARYYLVVAVIVVAVLLGLFAWQTVKNDSASSEPLSIAAGIDPEARNAFDMGWRSYRRETPEDYQVALVNFKRAITIDPDYSQAHAAIAAVYLRIWRRYWHHEFKIAPRLGAWEKAQQNLDKAMRRPTPLAHQVASEMLYTNLRFDEALAEAIKAVKLDPDDPIAQLSYANALVANGEPDKAMGLINQKIHYNPEYAVYFHEVKGQALFDQKNYLEAIASLEQVVRNSPYDYRPRILLIASYGYTKQKQKAADSIKKVNQLRERLKRPAVTVNTPSDPWERWFARDQKDLLHLQDGLRAAGLREW